MVAVHENHVSGTGASTRRLLRRCLGWNSYAGIFNNELDLEISPVWVCVYLLPIFFWRRRIRAEDGARFVPLSGLLQPVTR